MFFSIDIIQTGLVEQNKTGLKISVFCTFFYLNATDQTDVPASSTKAATP